MVKDIQKIQHIKGTGKDNMIYTIAFRIRSKEYYAEIQEGKQISFGSHKKDDIKIDDAVDHLLIVKVDGGTANCAYKIDGKTTIRTAVFDTITTLSEDDDATIYVSRLSGVNESKVEVPYSGQFTIGRSKTNDVIIRTPIVSGTHIRVICEAGRVHVADMDSTNGLFLNGKKTTNAVLKAGDILSIYTMQIKLLSGSLVFSNVGSNLSISDDFLEAFKPYENEVFAESGKYLKYHLSPRVREQLPTDPIVLSSPPAAAQTGNGRRANWAYMISAGAMLAASMATGMVNPAMLMFRAAALASPVANMAMYSKMSKEEKQQLEEFEELRQEMYRTYADEQKARIRKVADIQRRIITNENPEAIECLDMVNKLKTRLWERMNTDSDFLDLRLGLGKQKLCVEVKSRADTDGFQMEDDELERLSEQIIEETRYVEDIPVVVPVQQFSTIGLIGDKAALYYQLRGLITELTVHHSSNDVRLVCIMEEEWKGHWGFLRWLPHIWDESGQVRYISFDKSSRKAVCEMMLDVVAQRSDDAEDGWNKSKNMLPHYVVLVQNRELIRDSEIYAYLTANDQSLGLTTIFMAEQLYNLPQTCQYIVDLNEKRHAYQKDKYDEKTFFTADKQLHQKDMNAYARRMAAIELDDEFSLQEIPSAITFLQGYGVDRVEDLGIEDRWQESKPQTSLAAPIGMMTGGRTFSLDIASHEQAHGPHGLLAGTTGSGKSELLQSWILSMAVNYHPCDVNFVIIDYKGGGMSDLVEPLPHVVGKITNISRNIHRSLISLKSELRRRQSLFAKYGVNSIGKYQEGYKNGSIPERMPHLIIVTDEFAELKKAEPEFLAELNSVATIGRSLGIHMLLATQRPAGVVTDQINSNSRFRICMKVQDVNDSREMLKRSDAAKITNPGRAYIRVGEDELFELFQSYYSGAAYNGGHTALSSTSNRVRIVGMTGERIDPVDHKKRRNPGTDELTAIIDHINKICESLGIEAMDGPWLPELTGNISFNDVGIIADAFEKNWRYKTADLAIPVGLYDIPALQDQGTQYINIESEGHFGIYGIPSSGKATILKSLILSIGLKNSPENVRIKVLDAGNWSLSEYEKMPHIDEVVLNRDDDGVNRFMLDLRRELETRKQLFVSNSASSLAAYNAISETPVPAIVVIVNHLDVMFEQYVEFEYLMTDIAATGAEYGIHLVYTANTTVGIRYRFQQLIRGIIAMQMPDKGDYMSLVGRIDDVPAPNVPGRALIKANPPITFQVATLTGAGYDEKTKKDVGELLEKMNSLWETAKPKVAEDAADRDIAIKELLHDKQYHMLICSDEIGSAFSALERVRNLMRDEEGVRIIELDSESWDSVPEGLIEELDKRKKLHSEAIRAGDSELKKEFECEDTICLIINNLPDFASKLNDSDSKTMLRIFSKAKNMGVMIISSACAEDLKTDNLDALSRTASESGNIIMLDGKIGDYGYVSEQVDPGIRNMEIARDDVAVFRNWEMTMMKFW